MDQAELNALMHGLERTLRTLKIPLSRKILPDVAVNTRAKRRLGCCYYQEGWCRIEVSARIMEDRELLRQTLIHELLHTCPGCRNHGERWKAYAGTVNEALGVNIQRTVPSQEPWEPLRREEVKYILQCESCGALIRRTRMCKVVKSPWRYRCACGGKLRRIKGTP